jgi:hypothetical protein
MFAPGEDSGFDRLPVGAKTLARYLLTKEISRKAMALFTLGTSASAGSALEDRSL